MIDITGIDLKEFAKKVYELSSPQGLGFLHVTPRPLSDDEAEQIINGCKNSSYSDHIALSMDYVHGRACKMIVQKHDGRLIINDNWYDHSDSTFRELLDSFGIKKSDVKKEHGIACNCVDCRSK